MWSLTNPSSCIFPSGHTKRVWGSSHPSKAFDLCGLPHPLCVAQSSLRWMWFTIPLMWGHSTIMCGLPHPHVKSTASHPHETPIFMCTCLLHSSLHKMHTQWARAPPASPFPKNKGHHLMHTQWARTPPTSPSTKYKGHDQGLGSEKFTKTLIETVTGLITPTPPSHGVHSTLMGGLPHLHVGSTPPSCEVYHTPHVQLTTSLRRGPFHPHIKFTAPFLWDLPYPWRETHHTQYVESPPPLGSWHLFFSPAGFPLLS